MATGWWSMEEHQASPGDEFVIWIVTILDVVSAAVGGWMLWIAWSELRYGGEHWGLLLVYFWGIPTLLIHVCALVPATIFAARRLRVLGSETGRRLLFALMTIGLLLNGAVQLLAHYVLEH